MKLLKLLSFNFHFASILCLTPSIHNKRIYNGYEQDIAEVPYQLQIQINRVQTHFSWCGGAIISKRWALSAAHCFILCGEYKCVITLRSESSTWKLNGRLNFGRRLIIHTKFDKTNHTGHDLALVLVDSFYIESGNARAIALANYSIPVGTFATISGWIKSICDNVESGKLRGVEMRVLDLLTCRTAYKNNPYKIEVLDSMFCAKGDGVPTKGDSGSPLVAEGVLIGIYSWGSRCDKKLPGVFTNTSLFIDWIKRNINNTSESSELTVYLHPHNADIADYPYQVQIFVQLKEKPSIYKNCSGAILNEYIVVSTAHCVAICFNPFTPPKQPQKPNPCMVHVRVGSALWNNGGRLHYGDKLLIHENFTKGHWYIYDIALLHVNTSLTDGSSIAKPISLSDYPHKLVRDAHITGWGNDCEDWKMDRLKAVGLSILSKEDCKVLYGDFANDIVETTFCAKRSDSRDAYGDVGSPVVAKGKLIGLLSWTWRELSQQSMYSLTNMTLLRNWIWTNMDMPLLSNKWKNV